MLPANIGSFSVLFGKLMYHPDTRDLPFSYLIAYGDTMYLKPGRNFATVGLYRDIRKWPKRDKRYKGERRSVVNFDWLSPFTISEVLRGKKILEKLREASGDKVSTYNYHEYVIKAPLLHKGIKYYDMALRIYMGAVLKRHKPVPPVTTLGEGNWIDLMGLLMPQSTEDQIIDDIINGWSSKQAGMIYLALRQDTPKKDIAKLIGTSVQNVRNVLSSAKESLVRKYIERYRDIIMSHHSQPTI